MNEFSKLRCAFLDRECDESCLAFTEDEHGFVDCRRICDQSVGVRFKNWLFVKGESPTGKCGDGGMAKRRRERHE